MITEERTGEILVFRVRGILGFENADDLRSRAQSGVESGFRKCLLDLTEANLVDSTGIGVLVGLHTQFDTLRGGLRIAAVPPDVLRVLKAARLTDYLGIYPDPQAASRDWS